MRYGNLLTIVGVAASLITMSAAAISAPFLQSNNPREVRQDAVLKRPVLSFRATKLPKWSAYYSRHKKQSGSLKKHAQKLRRGSGSKIDRVNRYVNRVRYVEDRANWRRADYWATPSEFFSRGGDCEDYVLAKYFLLKELGIPPSKMQIVVMRDHAVLVVEGSKGSTVLDNQRSKTYPLTRRIARKTIFTLNEKTWSVALKR